MRDELFIGIDGGGTGCRARIRDAAGHLLGEGTAGATNIRTDVMAAHREIMRAAEAAAVAAGLAAADLGRMQAGLGLAGAGQAADRERLLDLPLPFARAVLDSDAYVACLGAHAGKDGAILIVGTGSCGIALVGARRVGLGGYGFEVSDDGSGAQLGREAVRQALWAHDGLIPATDFSRAVMAEFQDDPERIVAWAGTAAPRDHARLVPLVFRHAERGDPIAEGLVTASAALIGRMVRHLAGCGAPAICLMGGLAAPIAPWLIPPVRALLRPPRADAMDGAILMARRTMGNAA